MKYSNIPSAHSVVHHCKVKGIENIVISPGSRNAPLTIGFSENPFFTCYSIVDERCAAFFALGLAQQSQTPTALVCTSGSALLNYYPAIAEAFYSNIPLVVISADRPSYKIDIGDGQTIRQNDVFKNHIAYSAILKQDCMHATDAYVAHANPVIRTSEELESAQLKIQTFNDAEIHKAIETSLIDSKPVHINIPFEEPLYGVVEREVVIPFTGFEVVEEEYQKTDFNDFVPVWNQSTKKMVLVGALPPKSIEQQFLDELAEDDSVIVFTETTSNLHHPEFFTSIDSIIAPIEKSENFASLFEKLQPQVLLTFGGLIVSKKIKAFLRKFQPKHHWHVSVNTANDTFFCLSHHFKLDPNVFFGSFLEGAKMIESTYHAHWREVKKKYESKRLEYLQDVRFSDMLVFDKIVKEIPSGYQLQLANSSTVRYAQLFDIDISVKVFCNRGTSGIDGSTSTAIGASLIEKSPTLLITGDLSFFYDSNALWNDYMRSDFRIIVINNSGGGIFRILPGVSNTENFERYFETTHKMNASYLCEMYHLDYSSATDEEQLLEELKTFYAPSERPKLLEIATPRLLNNKILLSYFDFIS